jgi:hypothetical protein
MVATIFVRRLIALHGTARRSGPGQDSCPFAANICPMNVLDDLKKLEASIVQRYQQLQPALAEVEELRRVADRLGVDLDSAGAAPAARSRVRRASAPAAAPAAAPAGRKPRSKAKAPRRKRTSKRRDQVLKLIVDRPGITVPEIGKALKVDPTGLYRYIKQLESDGSITKSGKELRPTAG